MHEKKKSKRLRPGPSRSQPGGATNSESSSRAGVCFAFTCMSACFFQKKHRRCWQRCELDSAHSSHSSQLWGPCLCLGSRLALDGHPRKLCEREPNLGVWLVNSAGMCRKSAPEYSLKERDTWLEWFEKSVTAMLARSNVWIVNLFECVVLFERVVLLERVVSHGKHGF